MGAYSCGDRTGQTTHNVYILGICVTVEAAKSLVEHFLSFLGYNKEEFDLYGQRSEAPDNWVLENCKASTARMSWHGNLVPEMRPPQLNKGWPAQLSKAWRCHPHCCLMTSALSSKCIYISRYHPLSTSLLIAIQCVTCPAACLPSLGAW